jgi:hypothetical protein
MAEAAVLARVHVDDIANAQHLLGRSAVAATWFSEGF